MGPRRLCKRNKGLKSLHNKVTLGEFSGANKVPDEGAMHLCGLGGLHPELCPELQDGEDVPADVRVSDDVGVGGDEVAYLDERVTLELESVQGRLDLGLFILA